MAALNYKNEAIEFGYAFRKNKFDGLVDNH